MSFLRALYDIHASNLGFAIANVFGCDFGSAIAIAIEQVNCGQLRLQVGDYESWAIVIANANHWPSRPFLPLRCRRRRPFLPLCPTLQPTTLPPSANWFHDANEENAKGINKPNAVIRYTSNSNINFMINKCKSMRELKQTYARSIKGNSRPHLGTAPVGVPTLPSFCAASSPHGNLAYVYEVFNQDQNPSVRLCNSLIRRLSSNKNPIEALSLYRQMLRRRLRPNNFTYPVVIKACVESSKTKFGIVVHAQVVKCGFEYDTYIQSSLIHLYAIRKDLQAAGQLFAICSRTDLGSWNSMIDCYVKSGEMELAQAVFDQMVVRDVISWNTMINGYGILCRIKDAKKLFDEMPEKNVISWNSMLAGYAKCGYVEDAFHLFSKMPSRDVVSWNVMLACYSQSGKSNEALALFDEMQSFGIKPTEATMVSLLSACSHLGALNQGLHFHSYITDHKLELNTILGTALVDMYAKCGSISCATEVFYSIESKDILAWNTIINGLAMHGDAKGSIQFFKMMQKEGVAPNDITFVAVISACRHAGLTEEGMRLFASMCNYGIEPKEEHYGCVIDLLARAGKLEEAMELILTMPMEPNATVWGALLGGCMTYRNAQMGERVGKCLINLQPEHSGRYILLSNIYAATKRWDDARELRNLMKAKGVCKVPGASVIELKGFIHRFVAGNSSHPDSNKIYEKLWEILTRLKSTCGYSPGTDQVFLDLEEEEKEHLLSLHSEKLAIAYGFLQLHPGETIRIVKNLRVCGDCHYMIKLISMTYKREIIVRDRNRFHHFKDGGCSCLDFW
ncbi:hypothetical protein NMG60_11024169 [Bertholletia excelsa]